jgi:hypothetical protein
MQVKMAKVQPNNISLILRLADLPVQIEAGDDAHGSIRPVAVGSREFTTRHFFPISHMS